MQKLLIAALFVLAVTAHFGEVEESGRFGDLLKKGAQKLAPHIKDIAREVAPVLKDAIVKKIKSEINKKLNLDEVEEGQWGTYRDMRYRPRPNWNTSWDQMYRPTWNSTWDRPIRIRPIRNRTNSWERSWRMNNSRRMNLTKPRRGFNFVDETEESQWNTYRDMRYRPRPSWNRTWDQMYRPTWNNSWEVRPTRRPIRPRNSTWDRYNRMNLTRRGWNFVEETEESQWGNEMDWNRPQRRPRRNMSWESRRRRWNSTWDQMARPTWNSTWETRPRPMRNRTRGWFNQTRRNRTDRMRRPPMNRWNFIEETEESQWGQPSWDRPQRRPRRNMTWESRRRRWNTTWDQMARPTWNSTWETRPRPMRNRTNRWMNQTRRNRTDRMRRPPMNRWNFVEETEESQWQPTWNVRPTVYYPYRNNSRPTYYPYNRNTSWGMPQFDRPIYRPTPQWFNQTWRRPTWNNIQFEETEESQFSGRMIGAPFRRNRTETIRDRRERPLRDNKMKDNKKNIKDKKGGLKKGEQKGWWSRFADKFRSRKNGTEEGKPLKPNRPNRPMRPGMRPRPRLNATLFL